MQRGWGCYSSISNFKDFYELNKNQIQRLVEDEQSFAGKTLCLLRLHFKNLSVKIALFS